MSNPLETKGLVNLKKNLGFKAKKRPNESQRKLSKTCKIYKMDKIRENIQRLP